MYYNHLNPQEMKKRKSEQAQFFSADYQLSIFDSSASFIRYPAPGI
jgi:hypothetical protein